MKGAWLSVLSSKDGRVLFRAVDNSAGTSDPAPFWGAPSIARATLYEADLSGLLYAYTRLLSITTASLPAASVGTPCTARILAVGGLPTYRWTPLSGSLPPGLSLSTTGVIRGTANASRTYTFTFVVSDSGSPRQRATLRLGITVK